MNKNKYLDDLQEIKQIMSRSSKFISLSGMSGISTGFIALSGAFIAYYIIFRDQDYLVLNPVKFSKLTLLSVFGIAIVTLLLSIIFAFYFTRLKTKRESGKHWNLQSRRLITNLLIPLVTGGLVCIIFLMHGFLGILPAMTLIFYGLALVNASKFTLPEIRNLGIIQILLGLLALLWIKYSLVFWALGFGIIQIIYGIIIQRKYPQ